jgi:hypothetical protein
LEFDFLFGVAVATAPKKEKERIPPRFFKLSLFPLLRRNERQYSRMFIMDDEQSDVGYDGTGFTLLDNAGLILS